ncbi:MAG: TDP-4-keto-6-deoxy-D-glucose transaminase [Myxococcales bacterium]|nr:TDP-4-keto-6-deoxy-D-glucose transaminase [Myxococcales bacterium]
MDPDIPFSRPRLTGREPELVAEVLRSPRWSGDGEMTRRAARLLERSLGGGRALLTSSCTDALEMAALLLDLGPGDEVVVPAFTFVTTASAFALRGVKLVFVDIRPDTLCLDERQLARAVTKRTRAIVPVHYAGVACAMNEITEIAAPVGASVVEDNAHGLFATWRGRPLGSLGRLATQSFHDTKNITCGEGGALIVNDPTLVERAEVVRDKGTNRARFFRGEVDKYTWVALGSSFLPSELTAAVLVAQLEAAEQIQSARQRVWATYATGLASWAERHGVTLPIIPSDCVHPAHMFYLVMPDLERRTAMLAHLRTRRIHAVFHYQPLHLSELARQWGGRPGDLPVTERIADTLIRLPLYPDLEHGDQARVLDAVTSFIP